MQRGKRDTWIEAGSCSLILALHHLDSSDQPTLFHHEPRPLLAYYLLCSRRNSKIRLVTALTHKVSTDSVLWCLASWESIADPVQPGSEPQSSDDLDDLFDDQPLGSLGGAAPPGQQHGGFGTTGFDIGWSIPLDMAGAPVYPTPDFNSGASHTPSMNQGFNSLVPSHTGAQRHQWNVGNHFPPGDPSVNNFGAPTLFNSTGFPNPDGSTGHAQQRQFSSAAGNNKRNISPFGTQVAG